ncbi:MAG: hypothetical protein LBE84_00180 [Planctomycetota bacterium]|nr:hypothetical protein [Planctomycetota bacterium]
MAAALDGDDAGLREAARRIHAAPNREHLREVQLALGKEMPIEELTAASIKQSCLVAYETRGETVMMCGVSAWGYVDIQVWMTTTADAPKYPAWLLRNARRIFKGFDRELRPGTILWQEIPAEYARGLHFARHLGFREVARRESPVTGAELVRVEREVRHVA